VSFSTVNLLRESDRRSSIARRFGASLATHFSVFSGNASGEDQASSSECKVDIEMRAVGLCLVAVYIKTSSVFDRG
jgi:hypothetical protein